jgi:hypothetical protein
MRWRVLFTLLLASLVALPAGGAVATPSAPPLNTDAAPWPRPDRLMARVRAAGLTPAKTELLDYHVHSHLDVFVDGKRVVVPAGIGISSEIPERETTDGVLVFSLGGLPRCRRACISPLHTHTNSGILHTESPVDRLNTLGEFLTEWGVRFTPDCVGGYCKPDKKIAIYIDGERFRGDPASIQLERERQIALVIGKPPRRIPSTADFSLE